MIEKTLTRMEYMFKADLNGYLEFESKYPNSYTPENFCSAFDQTVNYFNQTEGTLEALHSIVFQAHLKRKDYETDFDIPRFENGVTEIHYLDLVRRYQLYNFTKKELWKMDPESGIEILFALYQENANPVPELMKIFIPLSLDLENREFYAKTDTWLAMILSYTPSDILYTALIQEYYDCIIIAFDKYDQQPNEGVKIRLQRLFGSLFELVRNGRLLCNKEAIYAVVELAKEKEFHLDNIEILNEAPHFDHEEFHLFACEIQKKLLSYKPTGMQKTLREYLDLCKKDQEDNDNDHIFKVMAEYICLGSLPNQRDTSLPIPSDEDEAFDRLEQVIKQTYGERTICGVKLKCIYIIRTRGMFWKSILKLITQFLDSWMSELQNANFIDVFTKLLVQENLMPFLYQHIKKHVKYYNLMDNATSIEIIKNLTLVMETCFNHLTNQELSLFRDHVFECRNENDDFRSPTFGSTSFWNIPFDHEVVRVTNQITSFEMGDLVPEEITKRLLTLSIIWPYEVVRQLILSCIQNKNQSMATIPVLHSLGNLCTLREKDSNKETLLIIVLTDIISPNNSEFIDTYMGNIIQFTKSCCHHKQTFAQNYPLILTPFSYGDQTLLSLKDVLNHCVLNNIVSFLQNNTTSELVLLRFALRLFNSLCEPSSSPDWTTQCLSKSDPPAFLYCSPEIYVVCFTKLLALRSFHDTGTVLLRLQDWESVLNCIQHVSVIISYALQTRIEQFPLLAQLFKETLQTFDRTSQLIWYNITRDLTKCSLKVPKCFFRITGALDDLFICDESTTLTQEIDGWHDIFMACKLSTKLTTELFQHAEQWTYNLLLLWNHPYEDTIIKSSLNYALHPATSLSVSVEYPNLIIHFLERLYESYVGVHRVIKEFNGYEQQEMIPIIQNLSENGTRQYFIILYIILLIKNNIAETEDGDEKQDNYYVSCLIKVMQDMENWGEISPEPSSYLNLKTRMSDRNVLENLIQETLEDSTTRNTTKTTTPTEPDIVYYPLLDTPELISRRALSILSFYHLCSLFKEHEIDDTQKQALERLIILIMEGFIDMSSRQDFQRMLSQQPKNRITIWKKKRNATRFVMAMRPAVTLSEEKLLRPVIVETVPNYKRILKALGLSPAENENTPTTPNYLYFHI